MKRIIAILLLGAITTGCSTGEPAQTTGTNTTSASSTMNEAESSSAAAAVSSTEAARRHEEDTFIAGIKSKINTHAPDDLNGRLTEIITAYCVTGGENSYFSSSLSILYKQYWRANDRWPYDLRKAAQQPGGCPQTPPNNG